MRRKMGHNGTVEGQNGNIGECRTKGTLLKHYKTQLDMVGHRIRQNWTKMYIKWDIVGHRMEHNSTERGTLT